MFLVQAKAIDYNDEYYSFAEGYNNPVLFKNSLKAIDYIYDETTKIIINNDYDLHYFNEGPIFNINFCARNCGFDITQKDNWNYTEAYFIKFPIIFKGLSKKLQRECIDKLACSFFDITEIKCIV